jgi:hypothetical protein
MTARNQRVPLGISSALDMPVKQGDKEWESAHSKARIIHGRFDGLGVRRRIVSLVPTKGAAFCSREEISTVVIGVSMSGLFGLSGFLVERN